MLPRAEMLTPDMPAPPEMPEPVEVPSGGGVTLAAYESQPTGSAGVPGGTDARTDGPAVLLSHANGFCAAVFAPLVRALGPPRCISYDARAHGRSDAGHGDMAWEGHRDDVLAVHDAFALRAPVGVGHSMGGAALLLAEQLRPGTFSALWLYEPIVFPRDFSPIGADAGDGEAGDALGNPQVPSSPAIDGNPLERSALRRRPGFANREEAFANFASKPPLSELSGECLSAYVTYGFHEVAGHAEFDDGTPGYGPTAITLACRPEDEAAGYRMGARHRAWEHLAEIGCPVVVLRGRTDAPGPAMIAPAIADTIPNGRLESHEELGHFGPLAEPVAMANSVLDLMRSLPR